MVATVSGIHLSGTHAARPAANTVPDGSLYSCSDHSLLYKGDYAGNSWSTWATLGTGTYSDPLTTRGDIVRRGAATTDRYAIASNAGKFLTSDGTDPNWGQGPMTTTGDLLIGGTSGIPTRLAAGSTSGHVLTSNGAGAAPSWQAGGGGGSLTTPHLYQAVRANGTNTITAAASGRRLIAFITSYGGTVTGVTCTNVTWTQMGTDVTVSSNKTSIWLGIATGTTGTSVTFTGSGTILNHIVEVADAVSTLDQQASSTTGSGFGVLDALIAGATAGALLAFTGHTDNTTVIPWSILNVPFVMIPGLTSVQATTCCLGYAPTTGDAQGLMGASGSSGASCLVSIV